MKKLMMAVGLAALAAPAIAIEDFMGIARGPGFRAGGDGRGGRHHPRSIAATSSIAKFENEQRPAFCTRGKDPFASVAEKRWGRLQPTCDDRDILLAIKLVGDRALADAGPSIELP